MGRDLTLRVRESDSNLVGKKIVAIDVDTKRALGLDHGDYVSIKGKRETLAQVWTGRPLDEGTGIVRMDNITRKNAGVGLNDSVIVKSVSAEPAKKVVVAPTSVIKVNGDGYSRMLKKQYLSKPLIAGEELMFLVFQSPTPLIVQKTIPKGNVYVDEATEFEILETPTSPENPVISRVSYEDIGGVGNQLDKIREMIELPLRHPELFRKLGIEPPKGVLLYGPPGTGKTMLAKAISNEANAHFIVVNGPSIMSKYVGGAEERLRALFKEAQENAPAIMFFDEIDAIAPSREEVSTDVEKRVVAQLLALMDGLEARGEIIFIAATNRPNSIDPALRRPGRFDREIEIGVPDKNGRLEILKIASRFMPLDKSVNLDLIVSKTHGFVGADLSSLMKEAAMQCLRRNLPNIDVKSETIDPEIVEGMKITQDDVEKALSEVQPSALREVFVEVPDVKWDDVGALDSVKHELKKAVEWPLKYPEEFRNLGIDPIKGVLLYGPPGTGKTMLAKAIANESEANFISIKGPELFSKWLGDSERAIRQIFHKARQTAPCIVFFDEIDSVASSRGSFEDSGTGQRVVNQLLTELDGMGNSKGVVFIAATNRVNVIDPAILRPGRIDKIIHIGLPDSAGREDIITKLTKKVKLSSNIKMKSWVEKTEGFSGAELYALIREAGLVSLDRNKMKAKEITEKDFDEAFDKIMISKNAANSRSGDDDVKSSYVR